jgi:hypothetical protein
VNGGKVLYKEPATSEKPFQIFYDSKEEAKSSVK